MRRNIHCFLIVVFAVYAYGCFSQVQTVENAVQEKWLSSIVDERTTKVEVKQAYGEETTLYKRGNVLIYIMTYDEKRQTLSVDNTGDYHLVLVFDQEDVLKKHNLIKVK